MAEDGYLFVRQLLAKEQILDVRRQMLEILADNQMVRRDQPLDDAVPDFDHFAVEPQPSFMKVLYAQYALEDLNAILHMPEITAAVDAICGEPAIPLPLFVARNIFPDKDAFTTPAHQDFVHFQGTTRNWAAWIPMGDCPAEMGGLTVAAGSHKLGLLAVRPALGAGALEVACDDELDWAYSELEAGDVLFHNCLTIHRGIPNHSGSVRLSIDCRFQPISEPMCAQSLRPHRDMVDWEDLYAGWSREDLQYYWKKHALKIVPFDWSHYERRDALAFIMAQQGDQCALSTLQRIVTNDPDADKRERAQFALKQLEAGSCSDSFRYPNPDLIQLVFCASFFVEDGVRGFDPPKRFRIGIVPVEIIADCIFKLCDTFENTASNALIRDFGEEALNQVHP